MTMTKFGNGHRRCDELKTHSEIILNLGWALYPMSGIFIGEKGERFGHRNTDTNESRPLADRWRQGLKIRCHKPKNSKSHRRERALSAT